MSLFGAPKPEPLEDRVRRVEYGLAEAEERLGKLEKALQQQAMNLEETIDRVYHWMQRTNARARAAVAKDADAPGAPAGSAAGVDPVSARILARRSRQGLPGPSNGEGEGGA